MAISATASVITPLSFFMIVLLPSFGFNEPSEFDVFTSSNSLSQPLWDENERHSGRDHGGSVLARQSSYIPKSKHFAMAKSSSCAMPHPRHCAFVPMRRVALALLLMHRWKSGGARLYSWSRLESGMMISRRPKRRASSENAPGPSSESAIQMIARFRWVM